MEEEDDDDDQYKEDTDFLSTLTNENPAKADELQCGFRKL